MSSPPTPSRASAPSWRKFRRRAVVLAGSLGALTLFAGLKAARESRPGTAPSPLRVESQAPSGAEVSAADIQRLRNLGKAYYEQGKYDDAVAQFEKVVGAGQAFTTDHLDLGLALMQDNQLDQALGELTTARQMDPKLLAVHYNLGILYKREQHYADAEAELNHVVGADPSDPAAWFNLGEIYFAEKQLPQSLAAFEHVTGMGLGRGQNFYVAATFHVFTILTRLRRPQDAQKYLKLNQEYRNKVPSISIQYPALEAGRYGAIIVPPAPPSESSAPAPVPPFADVTARLGIHAGPARPGPPAAGAIKAAGYSLQVARRAILPLFPPTVAVGDYDGDGHPDIYIVRPGGRNQLLHNDGKGGFTDVTGKAGVAGDGRGLAAVFADYDNSGHPSLLVAGLGGVKLYHNQGNGTFADETAKAGLAGPPGELDTDIIAFDSDSDGFLDIVTTAYANLSKPPHRAEFRFPEDFAGATSHLYRNNGDGTFSDITASSGLSGARGKMRGAVFADFNGDGYADLVFLRDGAPPLFYTNQGEDHFVDATAQAGPDFTKFPAVNAQVADVNHDGNFDLVFWSPKGYSVLLGHGGGKFKAVDLPPALPLASFRFGTPGTLADLNGDGFLDLAAFDASGRLHAVLNRAGRFDRVVDVATGGSPQAATPPAFLGAASLTDPGRLDLLAADAGGALRVLEGPHENWVAATLDGYKSNKQGVGGVVEFKAGDFYEKALATGGPVRIFIPRIARLDVVRVTWPNLIVENEMNVSAGHAVAVRESERLASSCPFLYVWNGERYVFLSDIMGVSPLGELAPDGTRIRPNPDQVVNLGSAPHAQNGSLTFQITSEMRETDYFDQLRLAAVDHPAARPVLASEIYSSTPEPPATYALGARRAPLTAIDDHGRNVLPLIRRIDGRYPTDFRRNRILGLAGRHSLTLDLGRFPASSDPALWLTGWVFWTDSNASRALETNKSLAMVSPYLQVRNRKGRWVTVIPDMGLPSGTNRTFRVDLRGKFLSSDHHVRIVTNLCVYWDRILLTLGDTRLPDLFGAGPAGTARGGRLGASGLRLEELPLAAADLHYRGFSVPITDPRHLRPDDFDYSRRLAAAPWNPFAGMYTRYGGVRSLVSAADDRLVVMAAGDEMTVSFNTAGLPPLPAGWKRDYFLYARGYAKDGEPNTADFRTSGPLPFHGMANYPYAPAQSYPANPALRQYVDEYETRPGRALIPPLAPAMR